jgi:hypothetical protein
VNILLLRYRDNKSLLLLYIIYIGDEYIIIILSFPPTVPGFRVAVHPLTDIGICARTMGFKSDFRRGPDPRAQTAQCRQTVQIESHETQEGPLRSQRRRAFRPEAARIHA